MFAGSGELGGRDGLGTKASFSGPTWIAVDQRRGILFVSNRDSHTIRKITSQGQFILHIYSQIIFVVYQHLLTLQ